LVAVVQAQLVLQFVGQTAATAFYLQLQAQQAEAEEVDQLVELAQETLAVRAVAVVTTV
jgi:hypothetical protein